ncbi:MAG: hypothetical protein ACYS7Y_33945 [Planctomycetota bacterium]
MDPFRKGPRCRSFLYRTFGDNPKYDLQAERVCQYISEAEHGDNPWTDFFNVPGLPWAIDWSALATDYFLWYRNTTEWEAQEQAELSRLSEYYYAITGLDPREENL